MYMWVPYHAGKSDLTVTRKLASTKSAQQEQRKRAGHAHMAVQGGDDWGQGSQSQPPELRPEDFVVAIPTHRDREGLLPSHRVGRQVCASSGALHAKRRP